MIDTSNPGHCRSCGAEVFWRTEASGKANPYNPPEPCKACGGAEPACKRCQGTGQMQVSHFATCRQAGEWRRRR